MSTSVRRAWIESSVVLGNGCWIAGLIASGCGGAAGGEQATRASAAELRHGLVAHVDAIAEDTALQRSGHSVVALDGNVYVARGVVDDFTTQTNTFPQDVWRLRTRSGALRELEQRGDQQPSGWSYSCTAADGARGGSLYLFGGAHYLFELDPGFFASLVANDGLYRFDLPSRRWSLLEPAGARPSARSGCTAEFFDGTMYMFAGISRFFEVNNELWAFQPALGTWTQLTPEGDVPPPRYKPAVALDESAGRIYYYGGLAFGAEGFARIDDFWVYDIATDRFRQLPSGITPVRDQGSMGVVRAPNGKRYVLHVGGDLPTTTSCVGFPQLALASDEIWAFDIEGETWSRLDSDGTMPRIEYHAGATVDDRFYFSGGWAEEPDPERTCRQEWNRNFFELSLRRR
jgi:N-acetylneuraminic acid mutarotase